MTTYWQITCCNIYLSTNPPSKSHDLRCGCVEGGGKIVKYSEKDAWAKKTNKQKRNTENHQSSVYVQ